MLITRCNTLAELNELASALIVHELQRNPKSLLCAATGNSPTGVYKKLAEKQGVINTAQLKFIKLDEWYGLGADDAGSCDEYLQTNLFGPLNISSHRCVAFDGKTSEPEKECSRIAAWLDDNGPIDLCILGLGKNGHVAFNEPAEFLQPRAHLAKLSATSLEHPMIKGNGETVKYGITLGVGDIMRSKKIILLVNGTHKKAVMKKLMEQKVSAQLPASLLWLHGNADCFYCDNDN
jgi:galactosamine-6-phosphate isomerase